MAVISSSDREAEPGAPRHVVVLGGGLGGTLAAFELAHRLSVIDQITLVSDSDRFSFIPSNPWVAVGWRDEEDIEVELEPVCTDRGIDFIGVGAREVRPAEKKIVLSDGRDLAYDFLVIATGPELAFDAVEGLGPSGFTHSICKTGHAATAKEAFDRLVEEPGPIVVGAAAGASCFGPLYEFAMILDTEFRRHRLRDRVPITLVTPEPYAGHFGLDGVGDTKGMIESELRNRHIKWIANARIDKVDRDVMHVTEMDPDGKQKRIHDLPFAYSMVIPAFRGIDALRNSGKLVNAKGFVIVDDYQRNPTYPDIFAVGVCVAIPPVGESAVPVGVPKTGFMIESMVTATAMNIKSLIQGDEPQARASWNAICLADFGDDGMAFVAQPQIPPRNVNWSKRGKWVHYAKQAFEAYFLRKIRKGLSANAYETMALKMLGISKLRHDPKHPPIL